MAQPDNQFNHKNVHSQIGDPTKMSFTLQEQGSKQFDYQHLQHPIQTPSPQIQRRKSDKSSNHHNLQRKISNFNKRNEQIK